MDDPIFQKLDGLSIIICKVYQHGVWPNEIVCYLTGQIYRKFYTEAVQIQKAIQQWKGIAGQIDKTAIPYGIDQVLAGLPIYPDRLMCRRNYSRYQYISRTIKSIQKYWCQIHSWIQNLCRGRVTREQRIQEETELRQLYILVNCQQIFLFCKEFHYIYICGGETELYIPV